MAESTAEPTIAESSADLAWVAPGSSPLPPACARLFLSPSSSPSLSTTATTSSSSSSSSSVGWAWLAPELEDLDESRSRGSGSGGGGGGKQLVTPSLAPLLLTARGVAAKRHPAQASPSKESKGKGKGKEESVDTSLCDLLHRLFARLEASRSL